jgi:CRISPR-associated helicase Cas3/CRISPR-associated endonuclease Cas3-HD
MSIYFAHTHEQGKSHWQTMQEHANEVSRLAKKHASVFGEAERAALAGKLHDLGKYGDLFQQRLINPAISGLDHWTAGAFVALQKYRSLDLALVIQGHHVSLQRCDREEINAIGQKQPCPNDGKRRLTETNIDLLVQRLEADLGALPTIEIANKGFPGTASAMLETRMLFSALVDADHTDTERTMNRDKPGFAARPTPPPLQAKRALELLNARLDALEQDADIPEKTRSLRRTLANACLDAASSPARIRTLTAPTGSGKTLGVLRFALQKAVLDEHVRRIIVVLPFLSILDQTVRVYKDLFAEFGEHYILEHHSLMGSRSPHLNNDEQNESDQQARMLAQNWDAPIVITTSVQFLESLHANRPNNCRKLHNIAGSVVLFDEVQTLPVNLAVTTLKTLSKLASDKYGCIVVFSTATQPAFDQLHASVLETDENQGWQPEEIVPTNLKLFSSAKRVQVNWQPTLSPTAWVTVADWLMNTSRSLCIVNLKRHALALVQLLQECKVEGLFHLSTALCPAHRRAQLERIHAALRTKQPCRLIATQCVEAGVDLDFPVAFRALGPYEAIAQAAGRCNRNNALGEGVYGQLTVFLPEDDGKTLYPPGVYERAADTTKAMLREFSSLDIDDPTSFTQYFQRLYTITPTDEKDMAEAIKAQNYVTVNDLYRLIDNDTINLVVPYNNEAKALIQSAAQDGIDAYWIRAVQAYTVTVFRNRSDTLPHYFEPVRYKFQRSGKPEHAPDWFVCQDRKYYDDLFGLAPESKEGDPAFFTG